MRPKVCRVGLLGLMVAVLSACDKEEILSFADQEAALSPEQIGKAANRGMSLFQCAALARRSESEDYKSLGEELFLEGHSEILEFVSSAQKLEPGSDAAETAQAQIPMIIRFNLGGPNPDFMAGRIWAAVDQYVDDELYGRSTWTHQKVDPDAPDPLDVTVIAEAEQRFREQNCELLLD